jgi:hypothetical protein
LKAFLDGVSPICAILIVIKLGKDTDHLIDEGATLADILMPYLNACKDYSFLSDNDSFILS